MTMRATMLPALAAALTAALVAAPPARAAEKCADQIATTKDAAESQPDAPGKAKALKILKDAETDLQAGDEAFCLDEVAAAKKALGLK